MTGEALNHYSQGAPVNLSQVTVRYWFARDGGADSFDATCDYAQVGCSNVTESVELRPNTTLASTTAITVYVNGQLVWGLEPGSSP